MEISPEYSLEGLMVKLKLQYFGHLMWRTDSLEKALMLVMIEGINEKGRQVMRGLVMRRDDRGWDGWMASPTLWMWVWAISGSWWWTGKPGVLQSMGSQWVGPDWATEVNWGFLGSSVVKNPPTIAGDVRDLASIPGWERSPGEGNDNPLQYSCLGKKRNHPMDRGAWRVAVHGVAKVWHHWASEHSLLFDLSTWKKIEERTSNVDAYTQKNMGWIFK